MMLVFVFLMMMEDLLELKLLLKYFHLLQMLFLSGSETYSW